MSQGWGHVRLMSAPRMERPARPTGLPTPRGGGARSRDSRRRLAPHSLAKLVSTKLYAQRRSPLYVEPVIAGLTSNGEPFLWTSDALGAPMTTDNFVVAGSCSASLAGICEAL